MINIIYIIIIIGTLYIGTLLLYIISKIYKIYIVDVPVIYMMPIIFIIMLHFIILLLHIIISF